MPVNQSVTLLHVEDDEIDVMSLKRSFGQARILNNIVSAANGEEALDVLRGSNGKAPLERPYILLIDINMPRMNGIELLQEIRADTTLHDSIAFILTTSDHEQDMLEAYDLNVAGYLIKQNAGEQFLNAVTMLEYYCDIVALPS